MAASVLALEEIAQFSGSGGEWIGEVALVAAGAGVLSLLALLLFVWMLVRGRGTAKQLRSERDEARRQAESLQERVWQLEQRLDRRSARQLEQADWERQLEQDLS